MAAYSIKNIYHFCAHKTASQWFKAFLSDDLVRAKTGLNVLGFRDLLERRDSIVETLGPLPSAAFRSPVPSGYIVTTLYMGYEAYLTLPKPDRYRAFFVARDPRDIVVSWYFSVRFSHAPMGIIPVWRNALTNLSVEEGLRFSIHAIHESGLFAVLRSWCRWHGSDKNVGLFRYEKLALKPREFVDELVEFLEIPLSQEERAELLERHSFARYSGGRRQGEEDASSHYRSGVPGDWRRYFTPGLSREFLAVTGDLLAITGYL